MNISSRASSFLKDSLAGCFLPLPPFLQTAECGKGSTGTSLSWICKKKIQQVAKQRNASLRTAFAAEIIHCFHRNICWYGSTKQVATGSLIFGSVDTRFGVRGRFTTTSCTAVSAYPPSSHVNLWIESSQWIHTRDL